MSSTLVHPDAAGWHRRLNLPVYRVRDAARYSGVPTRTISYWHRATATRQATLPGREPGRSLSYYELYRSSVRSYFQETWHLPPKDPQCS